VDAAAAYMDSVTDESAVAGRVAVDATAVVGHAEPAADVVDAAARV
jgi:hypothetical protein